MVETRRSDEPLVETVEPDALARRQRQSAGGAVPERGRKAQARSPEREYERGVAGAEPRNASYLEKLLASNETSFWLLMTGIATMAIMCALFTPVPATDLVFVAATWAYAALATVMRFPRKPRVEQPGPYPFRPVAAPPIRGFADQHQMMSLMAGVLTPVSLIMASRFWHIKFASDALRTAVASSIFLQLAQYLTEALGQWPARLAPPVWLTLPAMFGAARMRSLLNWFNACHADALFPRLANYMGFSGLKWLLRRHTGAELMLAATRAGAIAGLAVTLIDVLIALPLVEVPAFMDSRFVSAKPALHTALEPGMGHEGTKVE